MRGMLSRRGASELLRASPPRVNTDTLGVTPSSLCADVRLLEMCTPDKRGSATLLHFRVFVYLVTLVAADSSRKDRV